MMDKNYFVDYQEGKIFARRTKEYTKINYHFQLGHLQVCVRSIEKVFPNPDWYVSEHSHIYYEAHIIPNGSGTVTIEGESFQVHGGCFFITGPGVKHIQTSNKNDPMTEYGMKFDLKIIDTPEIPDPTQRKESLDVIKKLSAVYKYPFRDIYDIKAIYENIFEILEKTQNGRFIGFQNCILEIVSNLYQTICNDYAHIKTANVKYLENHPERIKKIEKYISKHYMENISISDLEKYMLLSYKQINRIMKKEFDQTFNEYLQYQRFLKAKQLIEETLLTVEQIAIQCGFSTPQNLYQILKKHHCPTPTKLRQEYKKLQTL